ncbi:TolC family protein [Janthinobacterium fluminis]|uniref:TolC family protein n=1 Tax=Janthinobacterium fluminis TaxID=2987524 RepID=A0ABT5K1L7_9BURK|nr:TolC family protein [Janthinobacterium fluminis]MDC8758186.1 TolC family protein [Janthinobacterium fluminis]
MVRIPGSRRTPVALGLAALLLSGCASFSKDGGLDAVSALTQARTGQAVPLSGAEAGPDLAALLGEPLSADGAVRVALMNNRGLKAALAELGASEADLVQAGRMRNPGLSFSRSHGNGETEIGRGVTFDLIGLLTLPTRSGIERGRFEQAKLAAAAQAVQLAADTRRAYFHAVAARQAVVYMEQAAGAAQAGAELAARMQRAGNWSRLDQARQQVFYADAMTQLARATHGATAARERLTRLLGLWGGQTAFTLPERLPDLPKAADAIANIEALAMERRLDVQMSKHETAASARALGLTRATGVVNVLDAGYANKSVTGKARENGYAIALELPLFDWGGARTAKAQALYMQAVHRTADTAVRARSEVREAYSAYRSSYDVARHHRDEVVPLRKKISDEVLLRYNGMLASVFELLSDAREQIGSVNTAIDTQRDFWIAHTDLESAINGNGGASAKEQQ